MRLPEQRFWDRTRKRLGTEFFIERIENYLAAGMPDSVVLADNGTVTFLEHKAVVGMPARMTTRILMERHQRLTVEQYNWQYAWTQWGGRTATLIGIGGDRQILVPGEHVDMVNSLSQQDLLDRARSFPQTWEEIAQYLKGQ